MLVTDLLLSWFKAAERTWDETSQQSENEHSM
jgi:hypothetical protein